MGTSLGELLCDGETAKDAKHGFSRPALCKKQKSVTLADLGESWAWPDFILLYTSFYRRIGSYRGVPRLGPQGPPLPMIARERPTWALDTPVAPCLFFRMDVLETIG